MHYPNLGKSNVAKGWFKIYFGTFLSVRKAPFPKGLSYYSQSNLLETISALNESCICMAWLFFYFHTAQVSTRSRRFKSRTGFHDLNFGSQHFILLLTWPFSSTSSKQPALFSPSFVYAGLRNMNVGQR